MERNFRELAHKKAFEVAYALFRVGASSRNEGFKNALERHALALLVSVADGAYTSAEKAALAIDYFIKFGLAIDLISQSNGDILISELSHLAVALSALMEAPVHSEEINLEDVLSKLSFAAPSFGFAHDKPFDNVALGQARDRHNKPGNKIGNGFAIRQTQEEIGNGNGNPSTPIPPLPDGYGRTGRTGNGNGVAWQIRQTAIVEKIRSLGTCRTKDIQEILPELSERTIRYDLQRLAEQGVVERIGNGGPATFYKLKNEAMAAAFAGQVLPVNEQEIRPRS